MFKNRVDKASYPHYPSNHFKGLRNNRGRVAFSKMLKNGKKQAYSYLKSPKTGVKQVKICPKGQKPILRLFTNFPLS